MRDRPAPTRLVRWQDINPFDALDLDLRDHPGIAAPYNEAGERCPWPWEPQQAGRLFAEPFACRYCGARVVPGQPHIDYGPPNPPER